MGNFEQEYYEAGQFWEGEAVQDEDNLKRFAETAALIPADATSLADIGCGNGIFLRYLQKERPNLQLVGVDRSQAALNFVTVGKAQGDITDIPLADHSFDCVSCLEVIEHLPVGVFEKALSELARVARNYIIISVPYAETLEENYTKCPRCKTSFNADLHLQNFSDSDMGNLLTKHGFKPASIKKAGERISFKGHYAFRKLFYPEQFQQWRSPICPLCGYKSNAEAKPVTAQPVAAANEAKANAPAPRRALLSYFTGLPKLIWPKQKKYYWIICLYKRN